MSIVNVRRDNKHCENNQSENVLISTHKALFCM